MQDQIAHFTTDEAGSACVSLPANTQIWVREDVPPQGFAAWESPRMLTVGLAPSEAELEDEPCLVRVVIEKQDSETGNRPQGWATLEGAVYELEDARGNKYTAETAWSSEYDGWIAQFPEIPRGKTRIREVHPPLGYCTTPLGESADAWLEINLAPESHDAVTAVSLDVHKEMVVRGNIAGCKLSETPDDPDIKEPLEGCEFALWLQDDGTLAHKGYAVQAICDANKQAVLDAQGNPLRGTCIGNIRSHEDGRFTSADLLSGWDPSEHNGLDRPQEALPYGSYSLVETQCPNPALKAH